MQVVGFLVSLIECNIICISPFPLHPQHGAAAYGPPGAGFHPPYWQQGPPQNRRDRPPGFRDRPRSPNQMAVKPEAPTLGATPHPPHCRSIHLFVAHSLPVYALSSL